ncbi:Alpha/Beta hydrolase protein [Corynascus similis CBS 632.67]
MHFSKPVLISLLSLTTRANPDPVAPTSNQQQIQPQLQEPLYHHNQLPSQQGDRPGNDGGSVRLAVPGGATGREEKKGGAGGVPTPFFASLERASRLVDITYCVGTAGTGIAPPFSCLSRCADFPSLRLVRTWNTGVLLSDSCGYIALDHGDSHGRGHGNPSIWEEQATGVKEIIVAFRGTYSIANTIVDLSTMPQEYVPYPTPPGDGEGDGDRDGDRKCDNCTVHMGFMTSWRNARKVVIPALKAARTKYPEYRVHLIGHSLGGAVAALAALEIRLGLGWRDVVVTTFGEPRAGNAELAEYIDRAFDLSGDGGGDGHGDGGKLAYRRVTHVGDPVPLLPLSEWGYQAHAGEVYIGKPDLPPAPEDLRLCRGDNDPECINGAETADWLSWVLGWMKKRGGLPGEAGSFGLERWFPAQLKLWQLLFAHRDYFWRLGLCVPGGDPADWGREKYNFTVDDAHEEMQDL